MKSEIVLEASVAAGAVATENRELLYDGHTCEALGWECRTIIVGSFGAWGHRATNTFSRLASRVGCTNQIVQGHCMAS